MSQVVVLLIKPIALLTFLMPRLSSDLKVPTKYALQLR